MLRLEEKHYEIHRNFLHTFEEKWRQNENVMLILNAIVLFSFDRPNLQNVALINHTQKRYIDLLEKLVFVKNNDRVLDICTQYVVQAKQLTLTRH